MVLPIYILDDDLASENQIGAASRWWLCHSLKSLNTSLDGTLSVYRGKPINIFTKIISSHNVTAIYWNRCYEPWRIKSDSKLKSYFKKIGIKAESTNGSLLWEPWSIVKDDGSPYKVFTPFYRKGCMHAKAPREPIPVPTITKYLHDKKNSLNVTQLVL